MPIREKTIKLLFANTAGRCSFTDCNLRLTHERAGKAAPYTLGEMAHIKGEKPGSNRYDEIQTSEERNGYENLILLCPNHHRLIDKPENNDVYSAFILLEMKNRHEKKILNLLEESVNLDQLKNQIAICLSENKQAWQQYGPESDLARKNPHSQELSAVWFSERLSTIVPNNRKIAMLLESNRKLFGIEEQIIISKFLDHVKSYEKWVNDEILYQAVTRFPKDFENLILE